ncbi:MAG TPA: hypothetical protein P5274_02040 [Candidatus Paceibacterota bacterium]|nr:hypothetical protein [Candidatus Paceibacterota bacterium]
MKKMFVATFVVVVVLLVGGCSSQKGSPCSEAIEAKSVEEATQFGFVVLFPVDGTVKEIGSNLEASFELTGPNPVKVSIVSPQGDVYRQTVTPPAEVSHTFCMDIIGNGLVTFRAVDTVTGEILEGNRAVSISPKG